MRTRTLIAMVIFAAFALSIVGLGALAAVKPAPQHPGQHQVVAKTAAEHEAAAAHHEKMGAYHKGMAEHHKSMAAEHKKLVLCLY